MDDDDDADDDRDRFQRELARMNEARAAAEAAARRAGYRLEAL